MKREIRVNPNTGVLEHRYYSKSEKWGAWHPMFKAEDREVETEILIKSKS